MADQIFITHCLQNDSVTNDAGFSVRASSTRDPELLKFALDYPAYELPLDMWSSDPSPLEAPRRLALVPGPRNTLALIHSAYAGADTVGRAGNYFSHVVFYPALSAIEALETWGSPDWVTNYGAGQSKALAKASDEPSKGPWLRRETITGFLRGKRVGGHDLSTVVCPARLQNDSQRAQNLLGKTLQGLLQVCSDSTGSRNRFYFVAEPGLVALLLYGACRLLPLDARASLTFSTFENMHRSLRQFKLAMVCGTYTSDRSKSLDPEYFKTRGLGLDTLAPDKCSPELQGDLSPVVKQLVQLAAEGKWEVIHEVHQCHVGKNVTEDSLRQAFRMYEMFCRAKEGHLSVEELLDVGSIPNGLALIEKNQDIFWPFIRQYSFKHDTVRQQFAVFLKQRVPELIGHAGQLVAATAPQWKAVWGLVRSVENSNDRLASAYLEMLQTANKINPAKPHVASMRVPLLQEWQQINPSNTGLPAAVQELLRLSSAQEFEQLVNVSLPEDWLAFSLREATEMPACKAWVKQRLGQAPDSLLSAFVVELKSKESGKELHSTIQELVPDQSSLPLFFRLLKNGLVVSPESLLSVVDRIGELKGNLSESWFHDDHLRTFLQSLIPFRERATPVWDRLCKCLSKNLLLGAEREQFLFERLMWARKKWHADLPAETIQVLDDWAYLLDVFADPEQETSLKEIKAVLTRRHIPHAGEILKEYFANALLQKPLTDEVTEILVSVFHKFCPPGDSYQNHLGRFDRWDQLVKTCQDRGQIEDLQLYYLTHHVSSEVRLQVAKDRRQVIGGAVFLSLQRAEVARKNPPSDIAAKSSPLPMREAFERLSFLSRCSLLVIVVASHLLFLLLGFWAAGNREATPPPTANGINVDPQAILAFQEALETHRKAMEGNPLLGRDAVSPTLGERLNDLKLAVRSDAKDKDAIAKALKALAEELKSYPKQGSLEKNVSGFKDSARDEELFLLTERAMRLRFLSTDDVEVKSLVKLRPRLLTSKNREAAREKLAAFVVGTRRTPAPVAASLVLAGSRQNGPLSISANIEYQSWLDRQQLKALVDSMTELVNLK